MNTGLGGETASPFLHDVYAATHATVHLASGTARRITSRTVRSVAPRQSSMSAIRWSISTDALAPTSAIRPLRSPGALAHRLQEAPAPGEEEASAADDREHR